MKRFDTDGSGNLDDKEMSAMKEYIQDKKDSLASERISASSKTHSTSRKSIIASALDVKSHQAIQGDVAATTPVGDFVTQMAFKNVSFFKF
jgi:hypothetical protein